MRTTGTTLFVISGLLLLLSFISWARNEDEQSKEQFGYSMMSAIIGSLFY